MFGLEKMEHKPLFNDKGVLNQGVVQLIRQAYPSLENPEDCPYYAQNPETVSDILAEQAVLDNNMDFFHKILEQGEGTLYGNDHFFTAVAQTKQLEFVDEMLKADEDYRLYNFFEQKTKDRALATINSLEHLFTVEKQFELTFSSCGISTDEIGVALAFLEKGITQKQILSRACLEAEFLLKKLFEEDV